jgi:hypothetical protein
MTCFGDYCFGFLQKLFEHSMLPSSGIKFCTRLSPLERAALSQWASKRSFNQSIHTVQVKCHQREIRMEENKSPADDTLKFTVYSYVMAVPLHVKQAQTGGKTVAVPILDPGASESLHRLHS